MQLTFHGGARTVTGSNYLLETPSTGSPRQGSGQAGQATKILIDCGLHQGSSFSEKQNYEPFPYSPKEIEAVFVTHAHIDHIGRLPQLYKAGFRGKIISTKPTKDFAEFLLIDSEHILRKEAEEKHLPPLYGLEDINETMRFWEGIRYHDQIRIGDFKVEFFDAGHILGSAFIVVEVRGKKIVFSGDLGNVDVPIVKDTEIINEADYALIESTYGGRIHEPPEKRQDVLEDAIEDTTKSGGVLMIPAFAMERTQALLYELHELVQAGRIPKIPVFIDSPLAIKLTQVYKKYSGDPDYFDQEALVALKKGDAIFDFPDLRLTLTTEQSKEINDVPAPKVVIAGAGMSQGGRILHHEVRYLRDSKSTILFIGYQATGSLGRLILDGAKTVKILGEKVPVRCRVKAIGGYSAHADQLKLVSWLEPMRKKLAKVFVVQGEEDQSEALATKIRDELAIDTEIPTIGERVML